MESLQLLTEPASTSMTMVNFVSNFIVGGSGTGSGEDFVDVKDYVYSLIAKCTTSSSTTTTFDCDNDNGEGGNYGVMEEGYYQKMRICALSILSNSLTNVFKNETNNDEEGANDEVSGSRNIDSILSSDEWIDLDHGLFVLLFRILDVQKHEGISSSSSSSSRTESTTEYHNNPKEVYLAAKCVSWILQKSMIMRAFALNDLNHHVDVKKVLVQCKEFGKDMHPLLASVSGKMLEFLFGEIQK